MADQIDKDAANELDATAYDANDEVQVNKARVKAGRRKVERLRFVEGMMSLEEGRKWMYEILEYCHVFSNPFDTDPYRTAFRAGEMNIGQRLLADVVAASEKGYLAMCKENR